MTSLDGSPEDRVQLVLDFLNSLDVDDDTDALADRSSFEEWIERHLGLSRQELTTRDWEVARQLRDTLRTGVGAPSAKSSETVEVPIQVRVTPQGLVSVTGTDPAAMVAAAVAELALTGEWPRVKICPADDCQWAFFDRSRNQSRQWCSMAVCGNRAKARAHRQRVS